MVAPHVQQAALAFYEAGQLARFVTSVCDDPTSLHQRFLTSVGKLIGLDLEREFQRRTIQSLPPAIVETHPWAELLRVAVARMDRDRRLSDFIWEKTELGFDRMVARKLNQSLTGVYGYEHISLATFRRARELGIPIAYDVPAPETGLMRKIMEEETGRFPELKSAYLDHTAKREKRRIDRRRAEWACADTVIVSSRFCRDTYAHAGLDTGKVRIVPLGAPPPLDINAVTAGGSQPDTPLKVLWAGSFSLTKGAHYLLDAWRLGRFGSNVQLNVFGNVTLPPRLLEGLPEGIQFSKPIPRPQLMERYQQSDVLAFPTLCDSFGMVATEAWSQGLPVITTESAGAADFLQHGLNGLLIKSRDASAIADAINWCLTHRAELRTMRIAARETAARWQWADYRSALRQATQPLFNR